MIPWLISLATSRVAKALWKPVAAIFGVLGWSWWQYRRGAQAAKDKRAAETLEAVQRGSTGAAKATEAIRSGKTPQEIVDENDAKWR